MIYFCLDQVMEFEFYVSSRTHTVSLSSNSLLLTPVKCLEGLSCLYELKEPNNAAISIYLRTAHLRVFVTESNEKHIWKQTGDPLPSE